MLQIFAQFYLKIIKNHVILNRWNEAIAIILEKEKGPRLDKLQIIQLIQANLQILIRVLILPWANKLIY